MKKQFDKYVRLLLFLERRYTTGTSICRGSVHCVWPSVEGGESAAHSVGDQNTSHQQEGQEQDQHQPHTYHHQERENQSHERRRNLLQQLSLPDLRILREYVHLHSGECYSRDVEESVAVREDIKSARSQPLWDLAHKEKDNDPR
ncbi:hypothetical protein GBAR_LOCUS13929 [Geodia barretti]|uniref:Uncharacterized protein n=1 Tax=Geodia barretti TaxID=519541 RepID=A0AA35S8H4_GEOBA|nr:hypothetical protein GBAR_LOCUS13929 [Geodia barretti]